jgi:RNA polymerase sigma-70 factor (ECF subfamily)
MSMAAASFEPHRRHLTGLAYRMLGSLAEAEDVVQDAYLRWAGADRAEVAEPRGFLTTIVTRLCLDHLKSARARRETYVGPWLPEPIVVTDDGPDKALQLAEDLSIALLLTLERLSPLERAAFLLHDVFEVDFEQVATMLDRSPAACRQLAARARRQVQLDRPRFPTSSDAAQRLVAAFKTATEQGDVATLASLLAEDVVLMSDGGGRREAALNPIHGRDRFLRFNLGLARKKPSVLLQRYELASVNGRPGLLVHEADGGRFAIGFDTSETQITAVYVILNPDKLTRLQQAADDGGG